MSYAENFKKYAAEHNLGDNDTFKCKEGDNRVRILTEPLPYESSYNNKPTLKWVCYLLDRGDATIKLAFLATSIARHLGNIQLNEDYGFADFPMPYDVTITVINAGTKEARYSLLPSPKLVPLTALETETFNRKKPINEVIESLLKKQEVVTEVVTEDVFSNIDATIDNAVPEAMAQQAMAQQPMKPAPSAAAQKMQAGIASALPDIRQPVTAIDEEAPPMTE